MSPFTFRLQWWWSFSDFSRKIVLFYRTPKLLSALEDYIQILKEKQQEPQSTKLPTAQEVVIEVVPHILQGVWELPPRPVLNMASQSLSILSTNVTKATLDRVPKNLTVMEGQAIFTHSIWHDTVQSILTEIRQKYPQEILCNFAPVLFRMVADVAKIYISKIFKPPSSFPDGSSKWRTSIWKTDNVQ